MAEPKGLEPVTILVLGPMQQSDGARVTAEARTAQLKELIETIVGNITAEPDYAGPPFEVLAPEDRLRNLIVSGVLDLVERAELVVIDLSGSRASVAYEVGVVHALGLPHILLTGDPQPPFYFLSVDHIARFSTGSGFDSADPGHARLQRMIRQFATNPAASSDFADNQLSQYYGLPIVDVAGPSGLAAGYFRNAVRRFVRPGGFLNHKCQVLWTRSFERSDDAETRRIGERDMRIGRFFAVWPPGELADADSYDEDALARTLRGMGLRTEFATIKKRPGDEGDMRDFGGRFVVRDTPRGQPIEFIEPAIIIDIPTTLYALQFSPRIRRLHSLGPGRFDAVRDARRRRLLELMRHSFERNLRYQLEQETDRSLHSRFHLLDLAGLPAELNRVMNLDGAGG
jgi:hypothetical protein